MAIPAFNNPLMELLCEELHKRTSNAQLLHCFPNDLHRFFLVLQADGHQESLYFCFSPPFLRFHLTSHTPKGIPTSLHPLNAYLQRTILKESKVLEQERILQLSFQSLQEEYLLMCEFFPKHPNYHLIKPDGTLLFSMHPLTRSHYQLPPKRAHRSVNETPWRSHLEVEQAYRQFEKEWQFVNDKKAMLSEVSREAKKLRKKEHDLLNQLQQCSQWADMQHEGDLIKSYFSSIQKGASSLKVHDWLSDQQTEIALDPLKTAQEQMVARFRKAKKLQAGIAPLTRFLEQIRTDLQHIKEKEQQIEQAATAVELNAWMKKPAAKLSSQTGKEKQPAVSPIYREYISSSGLKIWVGKNAKANDLVTFQLTNGRDWWLHIRGCPGSHVVIRVAKDQEPDPEALKDGLQLALYFSKARASGEGEVCVTQCKFVKKYRGGKAGQAQISQEKMVWVRLDLERIRNLQTH